MATARDYKSLPTAGGGLSLSSSTSVWDYGSYGTFTEGLSTGAVLTHITIQPHIDTGPATDQTHRLIIEIAKGDDDTLVAQIPLAWRIDSRAAHAQPRVLTLPEPVVISANTRIRGRVADSQADVRTHEGIKLFYYEEIFEETPKIILVDGKYLALRITSTFYIKI